MDNKPEIIIVCAANYCRSPVLERLLSERFSNSIVFSSAGLTPFPQADMDPRSRKFLEMKGMQPGIHVPRPISSSLIIDSLLVLPVDILVLRELNERFPDHKSKIRLATSFVNGISLQDPFRFKDNEYNLVMESIYKLSKKINEKDLLGL